MNLTEEQKNQLILADFKAELKAIQEKAEWLKKAIEMYEEKLHMSRNLDLPFASLNRVDDVGSLENIRHMTHLDAAKAFLRFKKEPCTIKVIMKGLQEHGHKLPKQSYQAIARPLMGEYKSGNSEVTKIIGSRGKHKMVLWGLKEWQDKNPEG